MVSAVHTLMSIAIIARGLSANQRKPPAIHDTHGQYNKMPKLTPAELSRMKAEKELRDTQDLTVVRRRQDELARQQLLRDQAVHRLQVGSILR
jgi:chromatin modification-related protein VID21